jgi:predicted nucleotidyltransferase
MSPKKIAELTARIVEAERPEKIILFGSYASGTATESSDIDLLVETVFSSGRFCRLARLSIGPRVPHYELTMSKTLIHRRNWTYRRFEIWREDGNAHG